ncbi:MAG TPA: NAD(P)/FAD-dependent oxidoreductase [Mycobacteriales bacterium]|nr:NAD(P)/FAD-dependent oxidoreductase [Mycobacteriales bacterium]
MDEFDVIVLGAGSTGENVADYAVQGGLTAAVVEFERVGGECSYFACMPSKALLRGADALRAARAVQGAAEAVTGSLDVPETFARRDAFTHNWNDSSQVDWLDSVGIALYRGHGRIVGERLVDVDGTQIRARHAVVVCTGSSARIPDIPGLAMIGPWTSREATSSHAVPGRLAVLGAGAVGVEMATAYHEFGSQVTLLNSKSGLLPRLEPFAGAAVEKALRDRGVEIRNDVTVNSVSKAKDGTITVESDSGTSLVDEFLVATGRIPNTTDIGLEMLGHEPGKPLRVDGSGQASDGWLYAAGDVTGAAQLTHMGKYAGRICGTAIAAKARGQAVDQTPYSEHSASAFDGAVPAVVFTDPAVASVGRTEAEARAAGISVRTVEYDMGSIAGASVYADGYSGRAKLIVDDARDVLVGATFVGPDAGELLHAATVAIVGEVPMSRLWHAVPSYPTISEVWLRLLETDRRNQVNA